MEGNHKKRRCEKHARRSGGKTTNPLITKLIHHIPEKDKLKKVVGEYLHNLRHEKPKTCDLTKVIAACPDALLYKNEKGKIPIQSAAYYIGSIRYVSLLATEASKRDIGPDRGAVLLPSINDSRINILQRLVAGYYDKRPAWNDEVCLLALRELRNANLLLNEDIIRFNLIGFASSKKCFMRLEYLLNIYPRALSMLLPNGNYAIHPSKYSDMSNDIDIFARLLKAGMDHFPHHFGFLFRTNTKGERAITQAIDKYGKGEVLRIIQKMIPSSRDNPILHHVCKYTPELLDDFLDRYPDAMHLKDRNRRHLLHVAVQSGLKKSAYLLMMIHSNKACIEERDPVTNLYPFMLAAASPGYKKDLTTIYKLLCHRPDIISKCVHGSCEGRV